MFNRLLKHVVRITLLGLILSNAWAATQAPSPTPIKVGGSVESLHDSSVADAEIAFRLLFNEILAEIDESFTVKIYQDNKTLIEQLKEGNIQALFISSLNFLEVDELIHSSGRFVVQFGPTLKQRYLILVRNDHKEISLSDLRGLKMSICTGHLVGKRYLDVKLLEQGLSPSDRFFSEVKFVKGANAAVVDLFFGKVDMALVPEFSYQLALELNPQIADATTVLMKSQPMIYQAVGMRYDFPQARLDRIEPHLLKNLPSKRLKHLLEVFHITRFYRATDDLFKEVRELNDRYRKLIRRKP